MDEGDPTSQTTSIDCCGYLFPKAVQLATDRHEWGIVEKNEKALRETQTLRAGCSKVEPKIFAPPQTPFPGRGTAKV